MHPDPLDKSTDPSLYSGLWIRNDFVSDPTPDPEMTFKKVWAPTPDPISDPATLVSASKELGGKLALYS